MRITTGKRVLAITMLVSLLLMALAGRLYRLQVEPGPEYDARAANSQRTLALPLGDPRGQILDRNGLSLTDASMQWGVAAFRSLVQDPAAAARTLSSLLDVSEADLLAKLTETAPVLGRQEEAVNPAPVWLERGISPSLAARIQSLGLPGVVIGPTRTRYGSGAVARHLVGFVNTSGGQLGLERVFDTELRGDAVPALTVRLDGRGRPMGAQAAEARVPVTGKQPYVLHTTLDRRIQQAVETVLDRHTRDAPQAAVVVLEPRSGDVLAMASRPNFEYEDKERIEQENPAYENRAAQSFAPGSVFKTVVAAAALDKGLVRPDERLFCDGTYHIGPNVFHDAESKKHGWITFDEALAQSCNVVLMQVGYERLGLQGLHDATLKLGFGKVTGLLGRPWPEEQTGRVPAVDHETTVQIAIGQGHLEVTPLQVARAYAAVANGGTLPPLNLVLEIRDPAGVTVWQPPAARGQRVMSAEAARSLQRALALATDPKGKGTGKAAWVPGVGSAGKTGTAETGRVRTLQGGKTEPLTHAWFAGYLTTSPRYVVVVMVEDGGWGGTVAAPIFAEIGQELLARIGD